MRSSTRDNNVQVFLALLRAGLWADTSVRDSWFKVHSSEQVNWEEVYQLAEEQSVMGVVLAGIDRLRNHNDNLNIPQELLFQWIGEVQMIEQQNKSINEFVAKLIEYLREKDVYTLLVKGQGIAQCYEKPLWRSAGDVDLLLNADNYNKAKDYLIPKAQKVEQEHHDRLHTAIEINSWEVELHGTLHPRLGKKVDSFVDSVQSEVFRNGEVRVWNNNGTEVYLPSVNNDVIFIFTHIIQLFFHGGFGLRQICDWCRLLWKYSNEIDERKLIHRLKRMKLMTEWKVLSSLAVNYLGMPEDAIPLFCNSNSLSKKQVAL